MSLQKTPILASLTKFKAQSTSINKRYPKTDAEGKKYKRTNFYEGEYEVVTLDWKEDFGKFLKGLSLNEVISLGTPDARQIGHKTKGPVGPRANPPFLRNGKYLGWNAQQWGLGASGYVDHNIMLLDIDKIPSDSVTMEDLLARVLEDLPALDALLTYEQTGVWGYPSAGAFIHEEETQITGFTGAHFYFLLPVSIDPDSFRTYIKTELLTNPSDHARYVYEGKNCITEARVYVDQKAIGKERLDYIAGTLCASPFSQRRPDPEYFELEPFDGSDGGESKPSVEGAKGSQSATDQIQKQYDFRSISAQKSKQAARATQTLLAEHRANPEFKERLREVTERKAAEWEASPREARQALERLQNGIVSGMTHLYFDSKTCGSGVNTAHIPEETVPAWQVLLYPDDYDGMTLADPRDELRRKNKAIFYATCPAKFLTLAAASADPGAAVEDQLTAGAPAIFGFKGGEAVMQIKMDLASVVSMLEGKSEEEMREEYGDSWYKLLAEGNGLSPVEQEEVFQAIKSRWGKTAKLAQKLVTAAVKKESRKAASSTIKEIMEDFDEKFYFLKSGDVITGVWEETDPLFPGATVIAQLPKIPFIEWHRKTIYDMDEKGKVKILNAAQIWWEREHKIKYSGVVFDPTTTERTIVHRATHTEAEQEYFLNVYKGTSVAALSPALRECGGKDCDGKGCLHWFMNEGIKTIDLNPQANLLAKDAEWRTWGCKFSKENHKAESSSCIWYFRSLYENICKGKPRLFRWGLDWIADIFQNPGNRKGTAFVMQGGQGVGKGLLAAPLGRIYTQHYYHAQSKREITGRFNLHLQNLLLLYADEASWGGDRSDSGAWKAFITEELKGIEGKGKNIYQIRNFVRMMISSNANWVVLAETDDRRHFILACSDRFQNSPISVTNVKGKFDDYWKKVRNISDEALLWELLNREITSVLRVAPPTEGLIAQKLQSMSLEDQFIGWMLTDAKKMFDIRLGNSEMYVLLEKSGLAFNPQHVTQKSFAQSLATKLAPKCAFREKNIGAKKERGLLLSYEKVMDWYSERFEYNEEDD